VTTTYPPAHAAWRWIAVWAAFPLCGLAASLALGPVHQPGPGAAAGLLAGLGIGAAIGWAVRRPVAAWSLLSGLGLEIGTLLGGMLATAADLTPTATALVTAAIGGVGIAAGQAILRPPLPRALWAALVALAWAAGWAVSLATAIDTDQGFIVFGASGALVFTIALATAALLATRRRGTPEGVAA